ncbi:hypothetical protein ACF0H5_023808 [Mactra antiquata]
MFVCALILGLTGFASCQVNSHVAFSAGLTHDLTVLHAETIAYDKVFVNLGNAYNPTTGVFTAPEPGLYGFQFHTLAHLDKSTWLELYQNGAYIASAYSHTDNDYATGGNSVVLKLAQGDTVQIKAVDNSYGTDTNMYGQPNEIYSTFSGYLLAPISSEMP